MRLNAPRRRSLGREALRVRRMLGTGTLRQQLRQILAAGGNTVAWYQPGVGVTGVIAVSAWANQLGTAGSLVQATGSKQPLYLPWSGANYIYFPGVASNTVTTPTKSITGNFTLTMDVASDDYTPAADKTLIDKSSGNDGFIVKWLTTDKIRLVIGDGVGLTNVDASVASGLADASRHTIVATWTDGVGASFTIDGVAWGTAVAAVKTLTNAAVSLTIGSVTSIGKKYDVTITNGASTTYYHLQPNASPETLTDGATWISDNGETWTLNNTSVGNTAQVVGSPILVNPSVAKMATAGFTLNQPETVYLVASTNVWIRDTYLVDGVGADNLMAIVLDNIAGTGVSPNITQHAGSFGGQDLTHNTLKAFHIITAVFNGASSSIQIDNNAAGTGNAGASNAGGIYIFAPGTGADAGIKGQIKELIVRSVADSAATQLAIIQKLATIHHITL